MLSPGGHRTPPNLKIFYGKSGDRADVSCDTPVFASLDTTLAVFRGLDRRSGFMGIVLDERFVLQMTHRKNGTVRVEPLDTSIPAFDFCDAEWEFAERLICAAAEGEDVFQVARASNYDWKHLDMAFTNRSSERG